MLAAALAGIVAVIGLVGGPAPVAADHVYVPDHCTVRDVVTPRTAHHDHDLTVLDWTYMVRSDHVPPGLVPASKAGFGGVSGQKLVRSIVVPDLAAMRSAMARAGLPLYIQSAYRSYSAQVATFDHWVGVMGYDAALRRSARPGHSEHQLGTAFDFSHDGTAPWKVRDWATTPTGAWLARNAWAYGFVMSYPAGATDRTCYDYEPWHWRWVGRDAAIAHRSSGLTLREFMDGRLHARFVDVRWNAFEGDIGWLADRGITAGCSADRYCPGAVVTREQMASFLVRALGLTDGADADAFTDDADSAHESDINRLHHAGITSGCTATRFCPSSPVSRAQMASFLSRALSLTEGTGADYFTDDDGTIHEAAIDRVRHAGVTAGCSATTYCPAAAVTRGQMAAFLHRGFGP